MSLATPTIVRSACPPAPHVKNASQRIAVGPIAARHRLADDGDGQAVAPVSIVEGTAGDDPHAGGLEERAVHGRVLGAKRLAAGGWDVTVDADVDIAGRQLERQRPDQSSGRDAW